MKRLFYSFILLSSFIACNKEAEEETTETSPFTSQELSILNQHLNLSSTPYNYSNISLPDHYKNDEAEEIDNTPESNPITDMVATLGSFFYDTKLSANNTISCASCHEQSAAFSDNKQSSEGLHSEKTRRNSMTLINSRYYENGTLFWDERATSLEDQVLITIQDHIEMGMTLDSLELKLKDIDYYKVLFNKAFGSETVSSEGISKALSQYIRSIVSFDSKFDEGMALVGNVNNEEKMPDFPNFTDKENLGMDIF